MSKIVIYEVGKTDDKYLVEGIDKYLKRLKHYVKLEIQTIKESRQKLATLKTQEETSQIFSKISNNDYVILLDEHGKELSSVEFAAFIEDMNLNNPNNLLFIIGGAYGHSDHLRQRANMILSFSKMTFSHQMIRLFLVEQIYRAFTIIKNEKYHNE